MPKHKAPASEKNSRVQSTLRDFPIFSFGWVTGDKRYNFERFRDSHSEAKEASFSFLARLFEISSRKTVELLSRNKSSGFETVPYRHFRCKISVGGIALHNNEKLYIIQFNRHNTRVICFKDKDVQNLFHIVAFDFDHSIYDHG
jgi:hypothetical protein